jgi:antitoxin MazE
MATAVQKWGNSLGIRIPKAIAEQSHLAAGTHVEFEAGPGGLCIRPLRRRRKLSLKDLLAQAKGRNPHGEWESSGPRGRETL